MTKGCRFLLGWLFRNDSQRKSRYLELLNEEGAKAILWVLGRFGVGIVFHGAMSLFGRWPLRFLPKQTGLVKFSILVPVYKPNLRLLKKAIQSVFNQKYKNFEISICDDGTGDPLLSRFLEGLQKSDPRRIRITSHAENLHISEAFNSAFSRSTGEWIGFLDQDDTLHPMALAKVHEALCRHPRYKMIYTDEEVMSRFGIGLIPVRKPKWSPDYLRSANYLCHFTLMERGLFEKLGGFRRGFEGSQDWDLVLRASLLLKPEEIGHLPKILYHWRRGPNSVLNNPLNKPYAWDAAKKAIQAHLDSQGIEATVAKAHFPTAITVKYREPKNKRIAVLKIGAGETRSIAESVKEISEDYIFVLPHYIVGVSPQMLSHFLGFLDQDKNVGVVAPLIENGKGKVLSAGIGVNKKGKIKNINSRGYYSLEEGPANRNTLSHNPHAVDGSVFAFSRSRLEGVKGLDFLDYKPNLFGKGTDPSLVPLCRHIRAKGLRVVLDATQHVIAIPLTLTLTASGANKQIMNIEHSPPLKKGG